MLTNCQYVPGKDNDGDSFRVRSGTNEFVARLYFVDAPETNLQYPERTREQSEHFGVTLDETMKTGRTARDMVREFLRNMKEGDIILADSVIRLEFLAVLPRQRILGTIGKIAVRRRARLLRRLSKHLTADLERSPKRPAGGAA